MSFKNRDVVYCPSISSRPYLLYSKPDTNGLYIRHRGIEHWFNTNGVPSGTELSVQGIYYATEANRLALETLYDKEFKQDVDINLYAINISNNGDVTDDWVFWSQEGYYDWHPVTTPTVESLLWYDIKVSPNTQELALIQTGRLNPQASKIICVGKASIWEWGNKK